MHLTSDFYSWLPLLPHQIYKERKKKKNHILKGILTLLQYFFFPSSNSPIFACYVSYMILFNLFHGTCNIMWIQSNKSSLFLLVDAAFWVLTLGSDLNTVLVMFFPWIYKIVRVRIILLGLLIHCISFNSSEFNFVFFFIFLLFFFFKLQSGILYWHEVVIKDFFRTW